MNKEVKILLRKGSIFIFPIIAWICIVVIVDPFNYFNVSNTISENAKERSAQQINSPQFQSQSPCKDGVAYLVDMACVN